LTYLGFTTEGKLAAIFIKPSLGVSNWPVILHHQHHATTKFAASPINISDKDYDISLDLSYISIVEKEPFCGT
jgi:hypothetical protein